MYQLSELTISEDGRSKSEVSFSISLRKRNCHVHSTFWFLKVLLLLGKLKILTASSIIIKRSVRKCHFSATALYITMRSRSILCYRCFSQSCKDITSRQWLIFLKAVTVSPQHNLYCHSFHQRQILILSARTNERACHFSEFHWDELFGYMCVPERQHMCKNRNTYCCFGSSVCVLIQKSHASHHLSCYSLH